MEQIITSLLETDAYKLSMGQAIYHQFSDYKTTWSFKCRNKDVHFTPEMVEEIRRQIKLYCGLRFTEDELTYIDNIKWMKGSYVDFLRLWQPRYEDFEITTDSDCGLSIETFGTWLNTSIEIQEREEGITAVTYEEQKAQRTVDVKSYDDLMDELQKLGEKLADNGYLEDLQTIVANQLGEGKKASDLKKGQEQLIEAIIYDIESFIEENNL